MSLFFYKKNLYKYTCVFFLPRIFSFSGSCVFKENNYDDVELQKFTELKVNDVFVRVLYESSYKEDFLKGNCFVYTTGLENFYIIYPKLKEKLSVKGINLSLTKFNNLLYKDFFFFPYTNVLKENMLIKHRMYVLFFGNVFFLNWAQFFSLFYNNLLIYFSTFIYKIFYFNFVQTFGKDFFFLKKKIEKKKPIHLFFCPFFFRNFQNLNISIFRITNRYAVYDLLDFGYLGDTFLSYFIFLKLIQEKNLILNVKKNEIFFNLNERHKAILFKKKTWYFWRKRTLYTYCKEFAVG